MNFAFMAVRNRAELTERAVCEALASPGAPLRLHLYDDRSDREKEALDALYEKWSGNSRIRIFRETDVPYGVWGKSYALRKFLRRIAKVKPEDRGCIAILDNDMSFEPGWLSESIDVLRSEESKERNITVVAPLIDTNHQTIETAPIAGHEVHVRHHQGACCWVAEWSFFARHGLPPVAPGSVHEEWFYVSKMKEAGEFIGCFSDPPLAKHLGAANSERERGARS